MRSVLKYSSLAAHGLEAGRAGLLKLCQKFLEQEAVARTARGGDITVPHDAVQWNPVALAQFPGEHQERAHLRSGRRHVPLEAFGIVVGAEIAHQGNSQI